MVTSSHVNYSGLGQGALWILFSIFSHTTQGRQIKQDNGSLSRRRRPGGLAGGGFLGEYGGAGNVFRGADLALDSKLDPFLDGLEPDADPLLNSSNVFVDWITTA
jgi:hypothetical protein